MIRSFFQNTRKPQGFLGRLMLRSMNGGHVPLSNWGLSLIHPSLDARVLDIGCGGGANIARLMKLCPQGFVEGIDYSAESVAFSRKKNAGSLGKRCDIRQGDAGVLPYADGIFDLVTAFETVYFWPDLNKAFGEILRVLKPGGQFLIICEADDTTDTGPRAPFKVKKEMERIDPQTQRPVTGRDGQARHRGSGSHNTGLQARNGI